MKFIKKFKSLNYNDRKISSINHIIIHYTNLPNHTEAIKYLCSSEKKVSSHFLISKKGDIYNLVPEVHRAWHAGLSKWEDKTDINSSSIGIELDYFPNDFNKKYSNKLIQSLIELLKYLISKYKIDKKNILGHSDIAPYRKIDPGKNLPWKKLYKFNTAFMPVTNLNFLFDSLDNWLKYLQLRNKKSRAILLLSMIGYDTSKAIYNISKFRILITSYQTRYLQQNLTKKLDSKTYKFIQNHLLNLLLTKD